MSLIEALESRQRRELASCKRLALELNEALRLGVPDRPGASVPEYLGAVVGAAMAKHGDGRSG